MTRRNLIIPSINIDRCSTRNIAVRREVHISKSIDQFRLLERAAALHLPEDPLSPCSLTLVWLIEDISLISCSHFRRTTLKLRPKVNSWRTGLLQGVLAPRKEISEGSTCSYGWHTVKPHLTSFDSSMSMSPGSSENAI